MPEYPTWEETSLITERNLALFLRELPEHLRFFYGAHCVKTGECCQLLALRCVGTQNERQLKLLLIKIAEDGLLEKCLRENTQRCMGYTLTTRGAIFIERTLTTPTTFPCQDHNRLGASDTSVRRQLAQHYRRS